MRGILPGMPHVFCADPHARARSEGRCLRLVPLVLLAAALLVGGCRGTPLPGAAVQPRDGKAGLQLTGAIEGRQVAVTDGTAELVVGDCDPNDGRDQDICFLANDIDGTVFVVVIENPDVLESAPTELEVGDPGCASPDACDAVEDVAVVDIGHGVGDRQRARAGTLRLRALEPLRYYAGRLRLELPDGRLSGDFDVIP